MTADETHYGPSPYHPGTREDCPAPDCGQTRHGPVPTPHGQLTTRELAVVAALAQGGGYRAIAARLGITAPAVRAAVFRAKARLDATTSAHLVARAIGLRLIPAGTALTPQERP